jgi:DNA-binding CsgD family transcriptional regulator
LVLNREFKTLKSIESSFDFFFNDSEIEEKLNIYFGQQISNNSQINTSSKLVIEQNKKKYIQLDTKMSRCLVLISENKTSKEIAQALSKSDRTIEKYTTFLRNYFNVKKKSDLAKVVYEIANN